MSQSFLTHSQAEYGPWMRGLIVFKVPYRANTFWRQLYFMLVNSNVASTGCIFYQQKNRKLLNIFLDFKSFNSCTSPYHTHFEVVFAYLSPAASQFQMPFKQVILAL